MTYADIIETESAKERFMGNYPMFSKYLYQFAEKGLLDKLKEALKTGTVEEAFEAAHDMKGVSLNLSLKQIEEPMSIVVEKLRQGELPTQEEWNNLEKVYQKTVEGIEKLKEENVALF